MTGEQNQNYEMILCQTDIFTFTPTSCAKLKEVWTGEDEKLGGESNIELLYFSIPVPK